MKKTRTPLYYYTIALMAVIAGTTAIANAQTTTKPATATAKPAAAAAQPAKPAAAVIDEFFKKYKEEGTGPALDYFFGTNKYFGNAAGLTQLKAKLDSVRQSLGTYIGKELISQKSASGSLVLYSYLVKHEVQPIRFTFIMYKPHNDWVFYRFLFDDQLDNEMEEGAKINNKRP
jgi:hypothetical protein